MGTVRLAFNRPHSFLSAMIRYFAPEMAIVGFQSLLTVLANEPRVRAFRAMVFGYIFILLAATFWGGSAVLAKHLIRNGMADAVLLSQARVTFAWILLLVLLLLKSPRKLSVRVADLWRFALLGVIGVAGANYFLYFAVGKMDTAVADLIQFTAPVIVAIWMWQRGHETMDRPKVVALIFSVIGSGLALGAFSGTHHIGLTGATSAAVAALCYAFLLIWGKHLSGRYPMATYMHYAFLGASLFWMFVAPPRKFCGAIHSFSRLGILVGFSILSVAIPYACFFSGLKLVPASRAGIVSTWEPVMICITAWLCLGEHLTSSQIAGVGLVLAAIGIVEIFPRGQSV